MQIVNSQLITWFIVTRVSYLLIASYKEYLQLFAFCRFDQHDKMQYAETWSDK